MRIKNYGCRGGRDGKLNDKSFFFFLIFPHVCLIGDGK